MFELTWADDGRATFSYGESRREGEPHIVWHRVGTHDVLSVDPSGPDTRPMVRARAS